MGRKPGANSVTISMIAEDVGVSQATVSRVFNGSDLVRPELAKQVLGSAARHNFTPKQSLRRDTLALVVEDTADSTFSSYTSAMLKELVQCCAEQRYRLDIVPSEEIQMIRGKYIKGVIGLLWNQESIKKLGQVKNAPVVAINALPGYSSVCTDEVQGLSLAVEYLKAKGHRKLGLITRSFDSFGDASRREAFEAIMKTDNELEGTSIEFDGSEDSLLSSIAKAFKKLKSGSPSDNSTVLIATSEDTGIMLMHCLDLLGLSVPRDVSIISHEALNQSKFLIPAHTTLIQDYRGLAVEAIRCLNAVKEDSGAVMHLKVPYVLIERESVADVT